jgi:hypothetical protein
MLTPLRLSSSSIARPMLYELVGSRNQEPVHFARQMELTVFFIWSELCKLVGIGCAPVALRHVFAET